MIDRIQLPKHERSKQQQRQLSKKIIQAIHFPIFTAARPSDMICVALVSSFFISSSCSRLDTRTKNQFFTMFKVAGIYAADVEEFLQTPCDDFFSSHSCGGLWWMESEHGRSNRYWLI